MEQNPGPASGALTRGVFGQNLPNTRARASSQSVLGHNVAADLEISRRQSFADEGSNTTHLLTAIRAVMKSHFKLLSQTILSPTGFNLYLQGDVARCYERYALVYTLRSYVMVIKWPRRILIISI